MADVFVALSGAGEGRSGYKVVDTTSATHQRDAFLCMERWGPPPGVQPPPRCPPPPSCTGLISSDSGSYTPASMKFNIRGRQFTLMVTNHPEIFEMRTEGNDRYYLSKNRAKLDNLVRGLDDRLSAQHHHGYGEPAPIDVYAFAESFSGGAKKQKKSKRSNKKKSSKKKRSKKKRSKRR